MAAGVSGWFDFFVGGLVVFLSGSNLSFDAIWYQTQNSGRSVGVVDHAIYSFRLAAFDRQQFTVVFGYRGFVW